MGVIDSELALAALIGEQGPVSGYGLAALARDRGMERWAGLSPSSVYKALRRLEAAGLVTSEPDRAKRGRGPAGRVARLTATGAEAVRAELALALVEAPEQSRRYRVALAAAGVLGADVVAERLTERARGFRARLARVRQAREDDPGARDSLGAGLVFDYVLGALDHEVTATEQLIDALRRGPTR